MLNGLDRYLFGQWLRGHAPLHLVGASIGAWRMTTAMLPGDPARNFEHLARAYIDQQYDIAPGETRPRAAHVSQRFADILAQQLGGREAGLLAHPRHRLHILTSRGRWPLLGRERPVLTALGYLGAYTANAVHRRGLGAFLERVVFSDPRTAWPLPMHDLPSREAKLTHANLQRVLLASCSIPFWLQAQHDLPGGPRGAYWDGGITDYHLHLDYRALGKTAAPLVLYPHFQRPVVPGWFDKLLKQRHRPSPFLDNLVLLVPSAQWVAKLPGGKLPDRNDFTQLTASERQRRWRAAVAQSEQLADAFDALTRSGVQAQPL